ncbi:Rho GTPase protein rac1, partial [Phlyctochytrium bullatum]
MPTLCDGFKDASADERRSNTSSSADTEFSSPIPHAPRRGHYPYNPKPLAPPPYSSQASSNAMRRNRSRPAAVDQRSFATDAIKALVNAHDGGARKSAHPKPMQRHKEAGADEKTMRPPTPPKDVVLPQGGSVLNQVPYGETKQDVSSSSPSQRKRGRDDSRAQSLQSRASELTRNPSRHDSPPASIASPRRSATTPTPETATHFARANSTSQSHFFTNSSPQASPTVRPAKSTTTISASLHDAITTNMSPMSLPIPHTASTPLSPFPSSVSYIEPSASNPEPTAPPRTHSRSAWKFLSRVRHDQPQPDPAAADSIAEVAAGRSALEDAMSERSVNPPRARFGVKTSKRLTGFIHTLFTGSSSSHDARAPASADDIPPLPPHSPPPTRSAPPLPIAIPSTRAGAAPRSMSVSSQRRSSGISAGLLSLRRRGSTMSTFSGGEAETLGARTLCEGSPKPAGIAPRPTSSAVSEGGSSTVGGGDGSQVAGSPGSAKDFIGFFEPVGARHPLQRGSALSRSKPSSLHLAGMLAEVGGEPGVADGGATSAPVVVAAAAEPVTLLPSSPASTVVCPMSPVPPLASIASDDARTARRSLSQRSRAEDGTRQFKLVIPLAGADDDDDDDGAEDEEDVGGCLSASTAVARFEQTPSTPPSATGGMRRWKRLGSLGSAASVATKGAVLSPVAESGEGAMVEPVSVFKVACVGDFSCGKSSLISSLANGVFPLEAVPHVVEPLDRVVSCAKTKARKVVLKVIDTPSPPCKGQPEAIPACFDAKRRQSLPYPSQMTCSNSVSEESKVKRRNTIGHASAAGGTEDASDADERRVSGANKVRKCIAACAALMKNAEAEASRGLMMAWVDEMFGDERGRRRGLVDGCDVVMLCYNVASAKSFENVKKFWKPILELALQNVPIVLVGCKVDLREDLDTLVHSQVSSAPMVSFQDACRAAREIGAKSYVECSALKSDHVSVAFEQAGCAAMLSTSFFATKLATLKLPTASFLQQPLPSFSPSCPIAAAAAATAAAAAIASGKYLKDRYPYGRPDPIVPHCSRAGGTAQTATSTKKTKGGPPEPVAPPRRIVPPLSLLKSRVTGASGTPQRKQTVNLAASGRSRTREREERMPEWAPTQASQRRCVSAGSEDPRALAVPTDIVAEVHMPWEISDCVPAVPVLPSAAVSLPRPAVASKGAAAEKPEPLPDFLVPRVSSRRKHKDASGQPKQPGALEAAADEAGTGGNDDSDVSTVLTSSDSTSGSSAGETAVPGSLLPGTWTSTVADVFKRRFSTRGKGSAVGVGVGATGPALGELLRASADLPRGSCRASSAEWARQVKTGGRVKKRAEVEHGQRARFIAGAF